MHVMAITRAQALPRGQAAHSSLMTNRIYTATIAIIGDEILSGHIAVDAIAKALISPAANQERRFVERMIHLA